MLRVSLEPHTLKFKQPAQTSRGALATRALWIVRSWDAEHPDVVGLGECGPVPKLSVDDRKTFGAEIEALCQQINRGEVQLLAPDVDGEWQDIVKHLPSFAFALETALLDQQRGGKQQLFDTPFSRGQVGLSTHGLIWMDSIAGILSQIERKVTQGFRVIKMKIGAMPLAEDLSCLHEIRQRYPQIELRLDANGAYKVEDALPTLQAFEKYRIAFLEQPIPAGNWQAMAEICRHSPIPIGLDEELIGVSALPEQKRLIEMIHPQHLILKPTLLGGFAACEDWLQLAASVGAQCWTNSLLESNIGLNAICQWTSSFADEGIHGLGTGQLFTENLPSPIRLQGNQLWCKA